MKIDTDFPEILTIIAIITGIIIALATPNRIILYATALIMGLLFGRLWHKYKKSQCVPLALVIIGFFLGYLLGGIYANIRIIAIMLLAGIIISYWLHEKKILKTW